MVTICRRVRFAPLQEKTQPQCNGPRFSAYRPRSQPSDKIAGVPTWPALQESLKTVLIDSCLT